MLTRALLTLWLSFLLHAGPACAQPAQGARPGIAEPRFSIGRFDVDGATLLPPDELERALAPFTGPDRGFDDVQRALEALEKAYADRGYGAVQVVLPEQSLGRGEVRLRVIEARVRRVIVEGNRHHGEANVRRSLPSLAPGRPPEMRRIAEQLRVLNENPAKQASVLFRASAQEGLLDAVVRVSDEPPARLRFELDSRGDADAGLLRVGLGFRHANLWDRDHVLTVHHVTSPSSAEHPDRLQAYPNRRAFMLGGAYRVPLYAAGASLELAAARSNARAGSLGEVYDVTGSGTFAALRYRLGLPRWGEFDQRLAVALDWRAYEDRLSAAPGAIPAPEVTVHVLSAGWHANRRGSSGESSLGISAVRNVPGGAHGSARSLEASRPGATGGYRLLRYRLGHLQVLRGDWRARIVLEGQSTSSRLVAGEQFGAGGAASVRGFLEREIRGESGHRGTIELHTPESAGQFAWLPPGSHLRWLAFFDWARTRRKEPAVAGTGRESIASAGLGLRLAVGSATSLALDYAVITSAGGGQGRGEGRLHAGFAHVF